MDDNLLTSMLNRLSSALALNASPERPTIIGISGPPGAGKSTVSSALVERLNREEQQAAYVPMDGFHLSHAQLDQLQLRHRKGAPETFDVAGYISLLHRLAQEPTCDIYVPSYSRQLHEPVAAALVVPAKTRVIITEGNYLASTDGPWAAVRQHLDELWFLDAADDVLHSRLLHRRLSHGDSPAHARQWITQVDIPNIHTVRQTARFADVVFTTSPAANDVPEPTPPDDPSLASQR